MNNQLTADDRIYVAGHRGLVGSAMMRTLHARGYHNLLTRSHGDLDLTKQVDVEAFFAHERPDCVILAAARVGGILANDSYPAEFIYENLMIESNVIHAAARHKARKLLFLGSSCIYPRLTPQPMHEDHLLTGKLESTNEPYAIAKIAGIKMCAAYNRQCGTDFICVMPTNLYGPGDNYDLSTSHVLPALIRKMHEAKLNCQASVMVWGSGCPRREFLYSDDMADACLYLLERYRADEIGEFVNIGVGEDLEIGQLAELVREIVEFNGDIVFDHSKPDGTPRKLLDVSRLATLGWRARTDLRCGIAKAYADYLERIDHREMATT